MEHVAAVPPLLLVLLVLFSENEREKQKNVSIVVKVVLYAIESSLLKLPSSSSSSPMRSRFESSLTWNTALKNVGRRRRRRKRNDRDDDDDAFFEEEDDHQRKKKETHRDGQSFLFSLSSNVARLEFDRRFVQRVSANRARIERRRPRPDGNRVPFFHLDLSLWLLILLSRRRGGIHGSGVVVVHGDERRDSLYV